MMGFYYMSIKNLKPIQVSQDLFENILKSFNDYVIETNDLNTYKNGYKNKKIIYRKDNELICLASWINYVAKSEVIAYKEDWRQIIVRCGGCLDKLNSYSTNDMTGPEALNIIKNIAKKCGYSKDDFENILNSHVAEYDEKLAQQHYVNATNEIQKFTNCYYYDINNAHGSALAEMLPKCKDKLEDMYKHRKDNDGRNKKIFNYAIGQLCNVDHRKTYNWIVQRTTKLLEAFDSKVRGDAVYINTDGIIYTNVKHVQPNSNKLGEFKCERGTVYTYCGANYQILLFINSDTGEKTYKGSLPLMLRDQLDLEHGIVVEYERVKVSNHYEYKNVKKVSINNEKINTKSSL